MKATIVFLLIALFCAGAQGQVIPFPNSPQQFIVNHNGEKQVLTEVRNKVLVKLNKVTGQASRSQLTVNPAFNVEEKYSDEQLVVMNAAANASNDQKATSLSAFRGLTGVESANYMLEYKGTLQGYTNEFIVRLLPQTTSDEFQAILKKYNVTIKRQFKYSTGGFVLMTSKRGQYSLFEMVDIFENSKIFKYATPNFYRVNITSGAPPNDALWADQWALNNSGQHGGNSGDDIKALTAWDVTTGRPEVRVAVIDTGVDLDHEDLAANLLVNLGFDATGNNSGGEPAHGNQFDFHGTACAGIIAAVRNNGIGIAGIAPNVSIVPIRFITMGSGVDADAIEAINYAVSEDVNADVLSCSWGRGSSSPGMTDAINNAATNGRDGLGAVVVFSTGNFNDAVSYPATLPNVIAVGATSMCDERKRSSDDVNEDCRQDNPFYPPQYQSDPKGVSCDGELCWGSNFGSELDIVAPGVLIPTTTIEGTGNIPGNANYVSDFNGTSAAAPYVAGVAALILSVNRCLTREQVTAVLELSASRLANYCYPRTSGHPNGGWNQEMGHGQVDAFKAVQMALTVGGASGSNITGTDQGASGGQFGYLLQTNMCTGFTPGSYTLRRHEVRANITYSQTIAPIVVGSSNGMSTDSPNNGRPFVSATNVTETSATLTTYVYEAWNVLNQSIGWMPTSPANVRFDWTVGSAMVTNGTFQNTTISGTNNTWATHDILAGNNVAFFPSPGPVVIQSGANVTWRARNQVILKNSTTIQSGATFHAVVGPFFTCTQYPTGRIGAKETLLDPDKPAIQNFEVIKSGLELIEGFAVSPNPFTDSFVVSYVVGEPGPVRIELLDERGVVIAHFDSEQPVSVTGYQFKIDAPNLAPGVYIINLKTSTGVKSTKVVRQ